MTPHTLTIPITFALDEQFFEDILVTALEGGSNYWIEGIQINHPGGARPKGVPSSIWASQALINGGSVIFKTDDDRILTLNDFHNGVKVWAEKHPNTIASTISTENNKITLDPSNLDANDADAILQYALFGKLVYG
jgi:hypothetical protein